MSAPNWLFGLLLFALPIQAEEISLALGEWPPYVSQHFPDGGPLTRLVSNALGKAGYQVRSDYVPWARALVLARNGGMDATFPWFDNPERRRQFLFSDPLYEAFWVFFHLRNRRFDWQSIEDLKGLRIGASLGYHYGEAFEEAEARGQIQVERISSDLDNIRRLLAGRIDLFPVDIHVGYHLIQQLEKSADQAALTHHHRPVINEAMYLLVSRDTADGQPLIDALNRELASMRRSGEYQQILEGVTQLPPPTHPPPSSLPID